MMYIGSVGGIRRRLPFAFASMTCFKNALEVGCTLSVQCKIDDNWLSFCLVDPDEVMVISGRGKVGSGRKFMSFDQAVSDLNAYGRNVSVWNVKVAG